VSLGGFRHEVSVGVAELVLAVDRGRPLKTLDNLNGLHVLGRRLNKRAYAGAGVWGTRGPEFKFGAPIEKPPQKAAFCCLSGNEG
jgi:hypothetical protein